MLRAPVSGWAATPYRQGGGRAAAHGSVSGIGSSSTASTSSGGTSESSGGRSSGVSSVVRCSHGNGFSGGADGGSHRAASATCSSMVAALAPKSDARKKFSNGAWSSQ